jgi:hypothetical protein
MLFFIKTQKHYFISYIVALVFFNFPAFCFADANLKLCLEGKYPSLCDKSKLSETQKTSAFLSEKKENLKLCLIGKYPSLCKKQLLSEVELGRVNEAELKENLKVCKTGKYPSLCKHNLLTSNELSLVRNSEKNENLKICLSGRYSALCKYDLLTTEQFASVKKQEEHNKKIGSSPKPRTGRSIASSCDSGHWIESVSGDGQIIKLEDGSIWEVDPIDRIDAMLWLPITDIVSCSDKLINTDDNEIVNAIRLK